MAKTSECPRCAANGRDTRRDNLIDFGRGHYHCLACQYHIFPKHYVKPEVKNDVPKALLPSDFTREVPASAFKWLLQYGLPWSYWKDSVGYSPGQERLVFTVGQPTAFSIGRYVGKDKQRKWFVWGDSHKQAFPVSNPLAVAPNGPIVLVEDWISSHKVGQVTLTLPLFGTQVHPCHIKYLIAQQKPVVLWLDADQRGSIMGKAVWLQGLTGLPVSFVSTKNDPKELSAKEINETL